MTASAVFILDVKGKVIISRNYRGDVPMNCVERFAGHVLEADEADERPVWLEHGTTYVYIKYNNLYIMAVTQRNSNAAMILLFLHRMVEVRARPRRRPGGERRRAMRCPRPNGRGHARPNRARHAQGCTGALWRSTQACFTATPPVAAVYG
jgi:hypothetical protein